MWSWPHGFQPEILTLGEHCPMRLQLDHLTDIANSQRPSDRVGVGQCLHRS